MFSTKATRWFGFLFLLMLALRIGYKYYRTQQPSTAETQMAKAQARSAALIEAIKADQAKQSANGARVVLADSTVVAADTTMTAN
jgi:predicted negative regulator of RcsB-dependent stress response